jgi:hypothetical protein
MCSFHSIVHLQVSYRHGNPPDIGLDMVGFRCAAAGTADDPH